MSHYYALVLLPKPGSDQEIHEAIEKLIAPYNENLEVDGDSNPNGHWDWWVVGGRWTGQLSADGYDATKDPANYEVCWLCHGTGLRGDALGIQARRENPLYGCNGCTEEGKWNCPGTGRMLKHAPQWVQRGNTALVRDVLALGEKAIPYAIVTPDGAWHQRHETYRPEYVCEDNEAWHPRARAILGDYPDCLAVVVDFHS